MYRERKREIAAHKKHQEEHTIIAEEAKKELLIEIYRKLFTPKQSILTNMLLLLV